MQIALPPEELYARAELIVDAEPTSSEVRWAAGDDGDLETEVWLAPLQRVKGTVDGPLSIVLPGGSRDGWRVAVEDVPTLPVDRPVRLFLIRSGSGWAVLGGEQGVLRLDDRPPPTSFQTEGYDWSWQDAPAEEPFELNTTSFAEIAGEDAIEEVFTRGLWTWNLEGGADLYVEYGGRTTVRRQGSGDDDHNAGLYGGAIAGSTLAISTSTFMGDQMIDCDTDYYKTNIYGHIDWYVGDGTAPHGQYDIQQTVTHELGHCLGLAHSQVEGAVMYPYNTDGTGDAARHLTHDDKGGIQRIYGLVAPELAVSGFTVDDAAGGDGDGLAEAGESFDLVVTVENSGDGTAWSVVAALSGEPALGNPGPVDVGHVGSPTPVGERVGDSAIDAVFALSVDAGCTDAFTAELTVGLTDATGNAWDEPVDLDVSCEAPDDGNGDGNGDGLAGGRQVTGGCGCDQGGGISGILGVIVAALLVYRSPRR
jgi:hypothetical protein